MDPLKNLGLERVRMEEDDRYVDVYYASRVEAVIAKLVAEADFARWRDCVDGNPGDTYFRCRYDWVLVKAREKCTGYNIELPYIAEYGRISGKWHFRDTQEDHPYFKDLEVIAWRPIEKLKAIKEKN